MTDPEHQRHTTQAQRRLDLLKFMAEQMPKEKPAEWLRAAQMCAPWVEGSAPERPNTGFVEHR